MRTARTLLSGTWTLERAPLRPLGATEPPADLSLVGPVTLPGNVQTQLGYADLWLDHPQLTTLNHDEWHYSRTFVTPAASGSHYLVFDGMDYFCDVWVNGAFAGHHEGAFSEWEIDVTRHLRPDGEENEVRLAVSCPWRVESRHFYLNPSTVFSVILKNSEYMKGNLLHYWDGLPLSGNAVFPFGPWRDVHLETRSGITLLRVAGTTVAVDGEDAEIEIRCEWWSDVDAAGDTALRVELTPETFDGQAHVYDLVATVGPGRSETAHRVTVPGAHLWWTWDLGPQDLYRLTADAGPGGSDESSLGIRTLERDPETLAYSVNGRRLFLRGVWYPFANIFSSVPTSEEHWRDAEMLREGGSNHIISFTFVEKPALYEACDRLGILLFQELPYHQLGPMKVVDPAYPRFREYRDWSLGEIENIVRQLRGHASLVVWGAFAETRKNERWVWGDYTDYSAAIGEIVARLHPGSVYHPSFCDFKEEHIWNGGFPFGEFWDHYDRNHNFISEFGAIAPPVVETLREILPPDAIWREGDARRGRVDLPIDVEEYSYRWAFDYAGLTTSVARMYRWADRDPPTLERFVDAIQWYQALGLRYCAETYRRKRFADVAGCRTWSYRENVPGIKFTVVDHRQRPKMGYFGLKAGYAPLLLSLDEQYPLHPVGAGAMYERDCWIINDTQREEDLTLTARLVGTDGSEAFIDTRAVRVVGDAAAVERLAIPLPEAPGAYLLRLVARRPDGEIASTSDRWLTVVAPMFRAPLRLLLLGQSRYNEPILEALHGVPGIETTVIDEVSRDPQDSSWVDDLVGRVDVVWFAGWDYAAHLFAAAEWTAIAEAVEAGVGFVHTGGQASFHGGDGRGALLDCTPLEPVLPVSLRPHDGVWDREPALDPGDAAETLGIALAGMPFRGFSRTSARPGSRVHARLDDYPLLVTGGHGAGRTAVFMGSFTKPLRMFRIGEGLDWEDPLDIEPHWARRDIRAYGPYWRGIRQLALGLLAHASGQELAVPASEVAESFACPLFERLAGLPPTTLTGEVAWIEHDAAANLTRGAVRVRNSGAVVARLVRGGVETGATLDHRFRDGFVDLLPDETATLRFEAACTPSDLGGLVLGAQNAAPTLIAVVRP